MEFKRKYGKSLPEKWPVLIEPSEKASKKLRVDNPIAGRFIIYPIVQPSGGDMGNSEVKNEAGIDDISAQVKYIFSNFRIRRKVKIFVILLVSVYLLAFNL